MERVMMVVDQAEFRVSLQIAHETITSYISGARHLARRGEKDVARDILRFLENSRLVQIFKCCGLDTFSLRRELDALRSECHPNSQPAREQDLKDLINKYEELRTRQGRLEQMIESTRCAGAAGDSERKP